MGGQWAEPDYGGVPPRLSQTEFIGIRKSELIGNSSLVGLKPVSVASRYSSNLLSHYGVKMRIVNA